MLIPEDSPLRKLPACLSRKQILIFDGIRYAAEMADIAYARLFNHLQKIEDQIETGAATRDIASAMLDAWSIVDSVHRFRDLVTLARCVPNGPWKRLLTDRTADIEELRHCVQHQRKEVNNLVMNGGQIWGYLSWAQVREGNHTGMWFVVSPGAIFRGDRWFFMGPVAPAVPLPLGRIRLNAFGRQVYLGKSVAAVEDAVKAITDDLVNGRVRSVGDPAADDRQGSDMVFAGGITIVGPPTI